MAPYQNRDTLLALSQAKDYRSFARLAMEARFGGLQTRGAFARMTRAAGFSSRSTVREVLLGRKRLAPGSFDKFILGLGLKGDLREFFALLVAREEAALNRRRLSPGQIETRLNALRERLLRRTSNVRREQAAPILASRERFAVFASLGTAENGAVLDEVIARSGLASSRVEAALVELERASLVRRENDRIFPAVTHFDLDALGQEVTFARFYRAGLEETLHRLKNRPECFQDRSRLYFEAIYSIDRARLAEFRAQLRALCLQFIDQSEAPEGDSLTKFLVAFEPYGRD